MLSRNFTFRLLFLFQRQMKTRDERIDELEEALRESVSITAEREVVLVKEEDARHKVEKQVLKSCAIVLRM